MAEPTPPPGFVPLNEPAPPPGFVPADQAAAPSMLESFGRGAAEGATFGFADELGMDEARNEAARKANPWTHFMGELAGGFIPMTAAYLLPTGAGQAAAAGRTAQLAAKGAGLLRSALVPGEIGTLGQAIKQGAKLGATYGALSGAGHADVKENDPLFDALEERVKGAAVGAAQGAPAGALLGGVGHGVYRGAQSLGGMKAAAEAETADAGRGALTTLSKNLERDRLSPQALIDQIKTEFPSETQLVPGGPGAPLAKRFWGGIGNKQPITAEQVEETVRRAMMGESASDISAALSPGGAGTGPGPRAVQSLLDELAERHLGPLNIVDRAALSRTGAGQNTQMTMRAAAATPGEHVGIARENLLERQIGAGGRLADTFDRLIGSSDYTGVAAKHAADLEAAGAQAYKAAYANEKPFDLNPIFNKWDQWSGAQRGPIPDAIRGALDSMRVKVPIRSMDTGAVVTNELRHPQTLEQFINARQSLSDDIGAAVRAGKNNLARKLTELRDELSSVVAKDNPDWVAANQLWRDGKVAEDALTAGAKMSTRLNASSRENLAEFTDAQKAAAVAEKALRDARKAFAANPADADASARVAGAEARLAAANTRQELFKVGLVRALNDMIANQGETHNLTRQLLLPGAKKMLREVLGKDADQFFKAVEAEAAMHRTYSSQFGSQTTPLREAIDELNWAPAFEASWVRPWHWPTKLLDLASQYAARTINAQRNKELMDIYTTTDPLRQLDILRAAGNVHQARVNAGNLAAKPVIGSAGPLLDAALAEQRPPEAVRGMPPYRP